MHSLCPPNSQQGRPSPSPSSILFFWSLSTTSNSSLTNTPNTHFQNVPFSSRDFYELYPIKVVWNDFTTDCTIFPNLDPDGSGTIQSFRAPKMCESQRHRRIAQCPIGKILSNPVHLRSPRQAGPASEQCAVSALRSSAIATFPGKPEKSAAIKTQQLISLR